MAKKKLTKQAQVFVVQHLAMFERPTAVQKLLKETFDIEVSLPAIINYDIANPDLIDKWKELFTKTRNQFIADSADIPIAHKSFRLRKLQNLFDKQERDKLQNTVEMRATLEQAAKESGDAFTNRRQLDIKDVSKLTDEELEAIASD